MLPPPSLTSRMSLRKLYILARRSSSWYSTLPDCIDYFRCPWFRPKLLIIKPVRLLEHTEHNFYAVVSPHENTIQQAVLIDVYYAFYSVWTVLKHILVVILMSKITRQGNIKKYNQHSKIEKVYNLKNVSWEHETWLTSLSNEYDAPRPFTFLLT